METGYLLHSQVVIDIVTEQVNPELIVEALFEHSQTFKEHFLNRMCGRRLGLDLR